ncbi:acyl carrier protein [Gandjariella thermophila]|uniref:acyl carrier protein n=1 Tax=Gandjariella thermophila TaxID=1931992 RepID=UPI001863BA70|nr:acyl carrier protein [Gandjariella thermophila]
MPAQQVTVDDLRQVLAEVAGAPNPVDASIGADAALEDLGYDSIAVLAAVAKIERDYGVKVDEEGLPTAKRLSDLVQLIKSA